MTMHVPGSDQRTDLRVVHNEDAGQAPEHALGLLENARRVADATVAEAKDEAERLLAAARERAAQVQREAREQGQKLRADAERESAQARHEAFGEAERLVAEAKAQISSLEGSVAHLREEREKAVASTRVMRDRLSAALEAHTSDGDGHQQGDGPYEGQHHQG